MSQRDWQSKQIKRGIRLAMEMWLNQADLTSIRVPECSVYLWGIIREPSDPCWKGSQQQTSDNATIGGLIPRAIDRDSAGIRRSGSSTFDVEVEPGIVLERDPTSRGASDNLWPNILIESM